MTLNEILANEELRRHEFPVARDKIFLAHAGVCPLPRRVADAISECARQGTLGDQETFMLHRLDEARKLAAQLLNCQTDEIALVGPTSLGLSFVAAGLNFRRGDNVLIYHDDYPSNVYPWMALAEQGAQVRLLNTRGLGVIRAIDVMGQVDENTRLVALASCHFISGFRIEIAAIGKFLRERGILFCLDAIQTLGAFPTTVEHVDFLAADAHKWLLGPCGAGIFYVRRELAGKIEPADLRLAQRQESKFCRAGKNRVPQRRGEIRGRHAKSARPRRLDCVDGTRAGNRRRKHRRRTARANAPGSCRHCRKKASRF